MEIKAIAVRLPKRDAYLILDSKLANTARDIQWRLDLREKFFTLEQAVNDAYQDKLDFSLTEEQRELLMPEGVTRREATDNLEVVYLDADPRRKGTVYLYEKRDAATVTGFPPHASPYAEQNREIGLSRYLILRDSTELRLKPSFVERLARLSRSNWTCRSPAGKEKPISRYEQGDTVIDPHDQPVDFNSLEFRKNPQLLSLVSKYRETALVDQTPRIVHVPSEVPVTLNRPGGREVISEVARVWR